MDYIPRTRHYRQPGDITISSHSLNQLTRFDMETFARFIRSVGYMSKPPKLKSPKGTSPKLFYIKLS